MPYATHRIVGVIELDPGDQDDFNHHSNLTLSSTWETTSKAAIRQICDELSEACAESKQAFEPKILVDTTELTRELNEEFMSFQSARVGCG